jgi:threonine-phosphate decarboxylase
VRKRVCPWLKLFCSLLVRVMLTGKAMTTNFDHGGNIYTIARSLGVEPEDILDFSASINPLGLAEGVREAVFASFDRVLHYPDSNSTELRQALADFHGVDAAEVLVCNGSTELIYLVPRLVGKGRGLIVTPAFSEYAKALSCAHMEVCYLKLNPENSFQICLEDLERKLSEGFEIMFFCNPGNPSGTLVPLNVVWEVFDLCRAAGTFLVIDEAFMDFREADSAKHLVMHAEQAIVLRSMTKFFAVPGMRVGYALASGELIHRLQFLCGPWNVNTPAQIACLASLGDAGYVQRSISFVEGERAFLACELARIGGLRTYPSAANYLLVRAEKRYTAGELRKELLEQRILIRDCSNFEGLDNRFFRVAVRRRDENKKLLEALREIFSRS